MNDEAPGPKPSNTLRALGGCLMVIIGLILLLPGVCALAFLPAAANDPSLLLLMLVCLAISAGGVALIVKAARGPKVGN